MRGLPGGTSSRTLKIRDQGATLQPLRLSEDCRREDVVPCPPTMQRALLDVRRRVPYAVPSVGRLAAEKCFQARFCPIPGFPVRVVSEALASSFSPSPSLQIDAGQRPWQFMAEPLIPPGFLFRFCLRVPHVSALPGLGESSWNLDSRCRIPAVSLGDRQPFADVRLAWNTRGLAVSWQIEAKQRPIAWGTSAAPGDRLRLWIDTRNTQNIHRASRFCHAIIIHAALGIGADAVPHAAQFMIDRAREHCDLTRAHLLQTRLFRLKGGYCCETWIPAECLTGYSPADQPRLGFYYDLRDAEFGHQVLSVGPEFPYDHDPSLWQTLELLPA